MVREQILAVGCCILALANGARGQGRAQIGPNGEQSVAYAPDGKWLVTGSCDGKVRIRDATTGEVQITLNGHRADVNAVAVSPDGRTIASASYDLTPGSGMSVPGSIDISCE